MNIRAHWRSFAVGFLHGKRDFSNCPEISGSLFEPAAAGGLGLRQSSAAFEAPGINQSGRGLPQSKAAAPQTYLFLTCP
jgi:hypothetical protein